MRRYSVFRVCEGHHHGRTTERDNEILVGSAQDLDDLVATSEVGWINWWTF
jgi:hypothetical protein